MKILSGKELAGFVKERQAHQVSSMTKTPKLLIIRDSDNPVITKYVNLKIKYGEDIGIVVEDYRANSSEDIAKRIQSANVDDTISGIILQLPLTDKSQTDTLCNMIAPTKDVDGLGLNSVYDSATATAILWLLTGYDITLTNARIALVGRGKLVGAPLYNMFTKSGYNVTLFHRGDDLSDLINYNIIITATGVPDLITDQMVKPGATIIDAGTASEDGVLKGDVSSSVRERQDLNAITPITGGVGPLTVTCLFDHVIQSASQH
ncbi:bifunctional 5,10-methylenetetrahydrofolate dehydrogenase/5,10-methenyltetrahydrofolate cyclohydrolase [Candidatus Saccharibacteria bacterium]|nr:bifunctional 5,10-methylenetetrahydrofolate dehydrogenase/5,10-methenyltetrahydrofolate cyclohydrolase [Candidatus Saccharibacteria bacterium]